MEFVDKRGEDRVARVSDWDKAEASAESGREVVHQFTVEAEGQQQVVSAEGAMRVLGFLGGEKQAGVKSVVSAAKTLARLKMQEAELQEAKAQFDGDNAAVQALPLPAMPTERDANGWWNLGDEQVRQIEPGPMTDERRRALVGAWRDKRLSERGWKQGQSTREDMQRRLTDLAQRIKRAETRLNATVIAEAAVSERDARNDANWRRDEAPLLESPTPDSLKARAARQKAAADADKAEQQRLADKAKADAQRDEFTLTGSDRPADVGAAAGQGDIFDQPADPRSDADGGFSVNEPAATYRVSRQAARPVVADVAGFTPEQVSAITNWIVERKDAARIIANLNEHKGTPWAKQALRGVLTRAAIEDLLAGRQPAYESLLDHPSVKGLRTEIDQRGVAGVWSYLESTGMVGSASKPVNAVNSSFIDCNPSPDCAKYCYATGGNYAYVNPTVKSELVTWAVINDPKRAAALIASQYTTSLEFHHQKALRLFDKGDGSDAWLPVIQELNAWTGPDGKAAPIRVQVFSKNPEFLRQVPEINLRMLSADPSNLELVRKNPDLPVAFVYTDASQIEFLNEIKDRVQVILPVKQGANILSADKISELPKWTRPVVCPVDDGRVKIGPNKFQRTEDGSKLATNPGEWNCTRCDKAGGVGCFHGSTTAKALDAAQTSVLNRDADEIQRTVNELVAVSRRLPPRERAELLGSLGRLVSAVRAGIDPSAEAGVRAGDASATGKNDGFSGVSQSAGQAGDGPSRRKVIPIALDQSNAVREPDATYATDLFGNPVPAPAGKPRAARPAGASVRGNAQPEPAVSGDAAADTAAPAGDYSVRTTVGVTAQRQLGAKVIKTAADAAAATQYLYKSAVERLDGIVVDKDGKPLAVVGGFKGALSQASVYPATLVGEAVRVPGAAAIWFSHNHPSGSAELSGADVNLAATLADVFKGSGIEPKGLLAIGGGQFSHTEGVVGYQPIKDIPAGSGALTVPAIEREQQMPAGQREKISSPTAAKAIGAKHYVFAGKKPGILLMDAQQNVSAWVPLPSNTLGMLRGTGGLNAIYRAVSEANAGSAILVHGGELDAKVAPGTGVSITLGQNIGAALAKIDVRPLDIINGKTLESAAEQGERINDGPVLSQGQGRGVPLSILKPHIDALTAKMPGLRKKPTVVDDVMDLPVNIISALFSSGGLHNTRALLMPGSGDVYLIANRLETLDEAEAALFHETFGHEGLRAILTPQELARALTLLKLANPKLKAQADEWYAKHGKGNVEDRIGRGMSPQQAVQSVRLLAVEEALADRAGEDGPPVAWKNVMAIIQKALRRLDTKWAKDFANWLENRTEAETYALLMQARKAITEGKPHALKALPDGMVASQRRFSSLRNMRPTSSYVDATPRQQATMDLIDEGPDSTDYDLLPAREDLNVSADAHFTDWEQERGIKYVPLEMLGPLTGYNNAKDTARIRRLADSIRSSNTFEPIFVGIDPNGQAYIMEGQHRARALEMLGDTHVPAQVIVSMEGTEAEYDAPPDAPSRAPSDYKAAPRQMPLFSRRDAATATAPAVTVQPDENGNPTFRGAKVKLDYPQPAERFEFIPGPGQQLLNYAIMPSEGFDSLGFVELVVENGQVTALLDIEINGAGRRAGVGKQVIETILAANPTADVNISNIVHQARGFWAKMGVPEQNLEDGAAYDGTLNWQTYAEAANDGRAAQVGQGLQGQARRDDAGAAQGDRGSGRGAQAPVLSQRDPTQTPAFKRWFGDSVVTKDGRPGGEPLVAYHGTTADFVRFDLQRGGAVTGAADAREGFFFASNPKAADQFTWKAGEKIGNIMPVYLSMQNPAYSDLVLTGGNGRAAAMQIKDAKAAGHDGMIFRDSDMLDHRGQVLVAFRPEQIKSAISNSTFDPNNPSILLSQKPASEPAAPAPIPTAAQQTLPAQRQPIPAPWRDATNRLQFAPGAWLYEALGKLAAPLLIKMQFKAATPELRRQLRQMKLDVQKAQDVAVAVAQQTGKLSDAEREMVSDIIEREMKAGTIPPAHAVQLAALMNQAMGKQSKELIDLGMLTPEAAARWDGAYLPRFYESKLKKQVVDAWADALSRLTGRTSAMKGIKGKHLKSRGIYEKIAAKDLDKWEQLGWEIRDPDYPAGTKAADLAAKIDAGLLGPADDIMMWRDFTRDEREKMGEIRDAGFRFVMGYMQTQRDIALGRMFAQMAADPASSSRLPQDGWVKVPDTTVEGTGAKRYGKLSGRYVPKETLSHLSQIEESQSAAWQMYRSLMSYWKMGKTVLNFVSHMNNVVSNLTNAHFAGVSYHRADKYLAAIKDFATAAPAIKEARDAGLFLGTMSDAELMQTLPKELQDLAKKAESKAVKGAKLVFDLVSWGLRKPLSDAYQFEDTFFRYLIYKDGRDSGMSPQDAIDHAQRYIFTYDDLPKGARMVRDFGVPFFAYTYKAVPMLLHTALTHPHRMAAPAAVLMAANAAAYAIAYADDDEDWTEALRKYIESEDRRDRISKAQADERKNLPPWLKGSAWIPGWVDKAAGTYLMPKTIRLGMDELTSLPTFMDVSRMIPGGDIFDVHPNVPGALPLPQPLTPSHPAISLMSGIFANRDLWTGKDLVDLNDTTAESTKKRALWIWRNLAPAISIGNYHVDRTLSAIAYASGGEISWLPDVIAEDYTGTGKDGLAVQPKYAAMQTIGIKVRPLDLEMSADFEQSKQKQLVRSIEAEMRQIAREEAKGSKHPRAAQREREKLAEKRARVLDGLTVDGDEKP